MGINGIGDLLGLLIIVGVVVAKALSNLASQQHSRREGSSVPEKETGESKREFSWEDWGWEPPETGATPQKTEPAGQNEPAAAKESQASEPYAFSEKESRQEAGAYAWEAPAAPSAPEQQPYRIDGQTEYRSQPVEGAETSGGEVKAGSIADQSFKYAFPEAMKKVRRLRRGTRAPIVLAVRGRRQLQRAILLREVLMNPRAYDL